MFGQIRDKNICFRILLTQIHVMLVFMYRLRTIVAVSARDTLWYILHNPDKFFGESCWLCFFFISLSLYLTSFVGQMNSLVRWHFNISIFVAFSLWVNCFLSRYHRRLLINWFVNYITIDPIENHRNVIPYGNYCPQ